MAAARRRLALIATGESGRPVLEEVTRGADHGDAGENRRDVAKSRRGDLAHDGIREAEAEAPAAAGQGCGTAPRDAKGHPAGGTNGSRRSAAARGAQEMEAWVMDLDSGRGAFMKYIDPLQREFGDLTALAACVLPKPISASVVGWIDSSLWPVLGVEALGHKLTFAKGICALSQRFGMGGPGAST